MNSFRKFRLALLSTGVMSVCAMSSAHAQGIQQDPIAISIAQSAADYRSRSVNTVTQTNQDGLGTAPSLSGATSGTIAPQGVELTEVIGMDAVGEVRVNNLANLEAFLTRVGDGMQIHGIAWGGPIMIRGFMHMAAGRRNARKRFLFGAAGAIGGLAAPGCINWLVASARDANLFS
jgi:hypothetical protein